MLEGHLGKPGPVASSAFSLAGPFLPAVRAALGRSGGEVRRCLVCTRLVPQRPPHLALPHIASSVLCASPVHPLRSRQRAPCVYSCSGTGDGRCCPRDINSHSGWWDLVGGRVGAEATCFYSPGSPPPRLGDHAAWPGRCVETAGV